MTAQRASACHAACPEIAGALHETKSRRVAFARTESTRGALDNGARISKIE